MMVDSKNDVTHLETLKLRIGSEIYDKARNLHLVDKYNVVVITIFVSDVFFILLTFIDCTNYILQNTIHMKLGDLLYCFFSAPILYEGSSSI